MTGTTQNCRFLPLRLRPRLQRMTREGVMAIFAGVEQSAAVHLDGDDVARLVEMGTTRFRIQTKPVNGWRFERHGHQLLCRERGRAQ